MKKLLVLSLFAPLFCSAAELKSENDAEFAKLFAEAVQIKTLATGLQFTEGPVWVGSEDGYLVFSDIPANKLLKWSSADGLSTFREPSQKINGNTLDLQGRLLSCEHWGRRVSLTKRNGEVIPVVSAFNGKKFNSPNDIAVRTDGTLWFTDPDYGLENRPREIDGNYVYRYDPLTGELTAVVRDFDKPNGLCFSPDGSVLYIADSGRPRHIRAFDVQSNGSLANGRVFVAIDRGGPDGIRCDADGRVWSSSGDGVQIFTPDGERVARVLLPKGAANLCFGGPGNKTLFMTARDSLFSVDTKVRGAN